MCIDIKLSVLLECKDQNAYFAQCISFANSMLKTEYNAYVYQNQK